MNKKFKIIIALSIVLVGLLTVLLFCHKDEKTYTLKTYNSDKKITDVSEYVLRNGDTIFHGKFTQYNEKGNKIAEGNFVNGDISGKSIYYYDNGKVQSTHFRKNSKSTLESVYNYPNGKTERYILFDYGLYDDFGQPAFIIRFDEQGKVKKHQGYPLMEIYQYKIRHKEKFKTKINQSLKVGDTLKYEYIIANIPNTKRSFKIENIGLDDKNIGRKTTEKLPVGIYVKEVLTKKGINTIRAIVQYKFNDKENAVINDTVSFQVKVN